MKSQEQLGVTVNVQIDHAVMQKMNPLHDGVEKPLSEFAYFAAAEQVGHATTAQPRMIGMRADVSAIIPATLTFLMGRCSDDNRFFRLCRDFGDGRLRRDHHESQIVADAVQYRKFFTARLDLDFRLQR